MDRSAYAWERLMAIPDYQTVMLALLRFVGDGKEHNIGLLRRHLLTLA